MTDERMKGKQAIQGATSLDAFIAGSDLVSEKPKSSEKTLKPRVEKKPKLTKRVGRPAMSDKEVRNKSLQIKLTEAEFQALKEEAGMVPISSFVREKMKIKKII